MALTTCLVAEFAVNVMRVDTDVGLTASATTASSEVDVTSADGSGGFGGRIVAKELVAIGGLSDLEVTLPLGPAACAALAEFAVGSCATGFTWTGAGLDFTWNVPPWLVVTSDHDVSATILAFVGPDNATYSGCATTGSQAPRSPVSVIVEPQSGTLTISAGDKALASEPVPASAAPVTIVVVGGQGAGCLAGGQGGPMSFITKGPPELSGVSISGQRVEMTGIEGVLVAGDRREPLLAASVVDLYAPSGISVTMSTRTQSPRLALSPIPLHAREVFINGIADNRTVAETYPLVTQILAFLLGILTTALVTPVAFRRYARRER